MLCQAEVEQLHQSAVGEEDVARRDVAMDDALVVRRGQRVGDLRGDVDDLVERQRARGRAGTSGSVPASSSIAMKRLPSPSSTSRIVQMLGWFSDEASRASRLKRRTASTFLDSSAFRTLMATERGRRVSCAS